MEFVSIRHLLLFMVFRVVSLVVLLPYTSFNRRLNKRSEVRNCMVEVLETVKAHDGPTNKLQRII